MKNHGISGKEMSFMIHLLTGIPPNSYQIFLRSNLKRLKMSHIRFTHVFSSTLTRTSKCFLNIQKESLSFFKRKMFVFTCIIKKEKHLSRFIAVLLIRNK